jgi:hypothetical protein
MVQKIKALIFVAQKTEHRQVKQILFKNTSISYSDTGKAPQ